eukprot:TRINITY_DN559_c3_g1_i1.p1 TRINITY_DN559_c3_g1~~TRINITY_DN559_c3_g1_i1.p1  ORF type:complete len:390 (-),score=134.56 TRINITY_DN559_c3_g1_i1:136-1305(-)
MSKVFEAREISESIVIDNGSDMLKAGFAGDDAPRSVFPSVVGKKKYLGGIPDLHVKEIYIGDEAFAKRGILKLQHPISNGIITNYDYMEKIWEETFYNELRVAPEDHQVLLTEPPLNTDSEREKMAQIMFETFNVPATYIANQAILSLFASGRSTGIVLNSGEGCTYVTPIKDGCVISNQVQRLDLGGKHINDYLMNLLVDRGYWFTTNAEKMIVRDIKEKSAYIALDFDEEIKQSDNYLRLSKSYELPDGQVIYVNNENFTCTEPLFKPNMIGLESDGIHQCLSNTIIQSTENDLDLRNNFYQNIVLSGGNTMFPGITDRLERELIGLAPNSNTKIKILTPPERIYSTWIGGSIIGDTLQNWVSKEEYNEVGPSAIKKCDLIHENIPF